MVPHSHWLRHSLRPRVSLCAKSMDAAASNLGSWNRAQRLAQPPRTHRGPGLRSGLPSFLASSLTWWLRCEVVMILSCAAPCGETLHNIPDTASCHPQRVFQMRAPLVIMMHMRMSMISHSRARDDVLVSALVKYEGCTKVGRSSQITRSGFAQIFVSMFHVMHSQVL